MTKFAPYVSALLAVALAGAVFIALAARGTVLIRTGSADLRGARFELAVIGGKPHLVLRGHDPGSAAYRGAASLRQQGGACHVDIDRLIYNPTQASGDFAYVFPISRPCESVSVGPNKRRAAPL